MAFSKREEVFLTHGFLEVNVMIEALIFVMHEALNFSDSPTPLVKKRNKRRRIGRVVTNSPPNSEKDMKRPPRKKIQAL